MFRDCTAATGLKVSQHISSCLMLLQYERRMALRVVRDEAAEASVRSRPSPQLPAGGPAYLEQQGIGSLKDYQHTGALLGSALVMAPFYQPAAQ